MTAIWTFKFVLSSSRALWRKNEAGEPIGLYGTRITAEKFVRLMHMYRILDQLLPAWKRDLYEDVDGEKSSLKNQLHPEDSPGVSGAVKIYRGAKAIDKERLVFIINRFNRSDFGNFKSSIDISIAYSDLASIRRAMEWKGKAMLTCLNC